MSRASASAAWFASASFASIRERTAWGHHAPGLRLGNRERVAKQQTLGICLVHVCASEAHNSVKVVLYEM